MGRASSKPVEPLFWSFFDIFLDRFWTGTFARSAGFLRFARIHAPYLAVQRYIVCALTPTSRPTCCRPARM